MRKLPAAPARKQPRANESVTRAEEVRERKCGALREHDHAARGSVIAINLGTAEGAKPGDVLAVYQKGALVRDDFAAGQGKGEAVRLPSERTGLVMVFKSFNNISYAYVLDAEVPLNVNDLLMTPKDN